MLMDDFLKEAHKVSRNNVEKCIDAEYCGCFYCLKIFDSSMFDEFTDEQKTVLCPYCGIDSVLPHGNGIAIDIPFLKQMHERWFGNVRH